MLVVNNLEDSVGLCTKRIKEEVGQKLRESFMVNSREHFWSKTKDGSYREEAGRLISQFFIFSMKRILPYVKLY